jgi:S1-C subfamily serine protease
MKMASFKLVFTLLLSVMLHGASARDLPPELLKELRDATVLVKVKDDLSRLIGTGFLVHRDVTGGFIITNQHIVGANANAKIEIIIRSGASDERTVSARVLSSSKNLDLALVRIEATNLPKPYAFAPAADLSETMRTYVLGFPFGSDLDSTRQNPAVTTSQASISSLRKNARDEVELIQLDGNLNPGNSGGPVVDDNGRLVGVAVARIKSTGIGFAIPAQTVASLLAGDIAKLEIVSGEKPTELKVRALLTDPLENIQEVSGVVTIDSGKDMPIAFKREGQSASATFMLPQPDAEVLIVARAKLSNGIIVQKPALRITVSGGKVGKVTNTESSPSHNQPQHKDGLPEAKPVQFGGKVVSVAASPDGKGAFVIREGDTNNELLFWNASDNTLSERIQVPRSPKHLASANQHVLVLCPDSSVVAVLDPLKRRIINAVTIEQSGFVPSSVWPARNPDLAYVLCISGDGAPNSKSIVIVEANLKTRTNRLVYKGDTERVTSLDTFLAFQRNFGGSPSGTPSVLKLTDGVTDDGRSAQIGKFEHRTYGPFHAAASGHCVVASEDDKTAAITPTNDKTLWTVDGTLMASWTDGTKFLLIKGDDLTNPEALPLVALDQNGQTLWKANAAVGEPISMLLTKNIFLRDRQKRLLVGTGHHGNVLTVTQRISKNAVSQVCVVGSGSNDHLLFCVSSYSANVMGQFALMIDEVESKWFSIALPSSPQPVIASGNTNLPPDTIKTGEELTFQPTLAQSNGEFILKNGPDGMKVDPKTGRIQWKTDVISIGRWDIEVVERRGDKEASVLKFTISVKN